MGIINMLSSQLHCVEFEFKIHVVYMACYFNKLWLLAYG